MVAYNQAELAAMRPNSTAFKAKQAKLSSYVKMRTTCAFACTGKGRDTFESKRIRRLAPKVQQKIKRWFRSRFSDFANDNTVRSSLHSLLVGE